MSSVVFMGVTVLLAFVIILGIRQYQLGTRYSTVITQSEKIIFQFSTIREQITISLIERDYGKINLAADQLNTLNSLLARLQENTFIPGEYRLDMAKHADLSELAIFAKEIFISGDKVSQGLILQNKMRSLAEYMLKFDKIIVSQMRAKVVRFQAMMIGALGAVICLISFCLIFLYRKTMLPLLHLTRQAKEAGIIEDGLSYELEACSEISFFISAINSLLTRSGAHQQTEEEWQQNNEQFVENINTSNNLANGIINYAQLLTDSYREVEIGAEETKILQNIIDTAEQIALLNKETREQNICSITP